MSSLYLFCNYRGIVLLSFGDDHPLLLQQIVDLNRYIVPVTYNIPHCNIVKLQRSVAAIEHIEIVSSLCLVLRGVK